MESITRRIADELSVDQAQVRSAVALLDGGATVPFIARYRKEATGGLDDIALRALETRLVYLRELEQRRTAVIQAVREQGKLSDGLLLALQAAPSKQELEDLYLPFKKKRHTRGELARAAGLELLADRLLADPGLAPPNEALAFVIPLREAAVGEDKQPDFSSAQAVLDGVRDLLSERWAEQGTLVGELRNPNGMAFSLDDQILYIVESGHGVWAYDVGQDGSLRNKALFALIDGRGPDIGDGCDGLTVDAEGNVLVCCVATSEIRTFGADGTLKSRLKLPVRPTSLEFGGDDLMDLYVSTGELQEKGRGKMLLFRTEIPGRRSHQAKLKLDRFIG